MASLLQLCDGETYEIHFFILLLSIDCIALLAIDFNFDYLVMKCLVSCLTSSPIIYSQILR